MDMNDKKCEILFDAISDAVVVTDEACSITRANRAFSDLTGLPWEEIIGKKCYTLIRGADSPHENCPQKELLMSRQKVEREIYEPYLKKHLSCTLYPVPDEDRNVRQIIHIYKDVTEQKRLDAALKNTKETILSVYEHSPYPIGIMKADYTFKYVNPKMSDMIGKPAGELLGKQCYRVVHGREAVCADCIVEEVKRRKTPLTEEKHLIAPDGKELFFKRTFYPLMDETGEPESIVEIINDITDIRLAEKELRESRAFLYSVLEGIGDAVIVLDKDRIILSANTGFLKQSGLKLDEALGGHCYKISHGYDRPCHEMGEDCGLERVFREGSSPGILHEHKDGAGGKIFVACNYYPLKNEAGDVYAVVETISDVTKEINLQRRLKESEEKYRTLYNNAPDLMHSLNSDGYIIECNETELKSLGYARDELIGRHIKEIVAPEYHGLFEEKFQELKDRGSAEVEWHILKKNGERLMVHVRVSAIYDESGQFVKSSAIMYDLTESRRLQREKEELMTQLFHAQKMEAVGNLAAGIAHDFNNMLTGISGFAELALSRWQSPKTVKTYIKRVLQITKQASLLTEQILIIGKKARINKKPIDVNKFISTYLPTIKRMLEKNIMIETVYGRNLPPVDADEGQFYQVVLNLIVNARDAMPSGGKITIRTGLSGKWFYDSSDYISETITEEGKDHVFILISDTGAGIPPEVKRNIFNPFFTTKEKGTGLGLAVVYSIIQSHNGAINVKSEEGKGTEFFLSFPAMPFMETVAEERKDIELETVAGNGKSILVVDDEEIVRDVIKEILPEYGFKVTVADDGGKALEIFNSSPVPFDLVMVDMVMPGMSGREVLKKIQEIKPGQRVISITGYAAESDLEELQQLGITDILKKPFSLSDVLLIVRKMIE